MNMYVDLKKHFVATNGKEFGVSLTLDQLFTHITNLYLII